MKKVGAFFVPLCVACLVQAQVAVPYYNASQVWQGLYQVHVPAVTRHFALEAQALSQTVAQHCSDPQATPLLERQWQATLQAWVAASTPTIGPVLSRRSQRQIDFSPIRWTLLNKALEQPPASPADWERVGTPAKGFSSLEWVLQAPRDAARCSYASGLAQDIEREATALWQLSRSAADQVPDEAHVGPAFAEWVNQWLGAWERLRWGQIEQPIQKSRTSGKPVVWVRAQAEHNVADWRAQWQALYAQARMSPSQRQRPPMPGQDLIPIEALLMGKGHIELAHRWAQSLDRLDERMHRLNAKSAPQTWLAWAQSMKVVTALFQNEVATALDVPLGFSDADGD